MKKLSVLIILTLLLSRPAFASLSLDGSAGNTAGSSPITVSLTGAKTNDIIVACIASNNNPVTAVTGSTLGAFTQIVAEGIGQNRIGAWYARATSPLSSETITATAPGTSPATNFMTISAFGVNGANTSSIFDPHSGLPASGTTDPQTVSTTSSPDFIFGCFRQTTDASPTAGAGWTQIYGANFMLSEYQIAASPQTNLSVSINFGVADANGALADAIKAGGNGSMLLGNSPF